MTGVRGSDRAPGEFRRLQNQIGRPPRFVPPPANEVSELLDDFERYLHEDDELDPLVRAFVVHYQFEAIHPFMDGNGRVGRLLLAITIEEWCDLSAPWLYLSDFFDRDKDDYIDRMLAVSTEGDWEAWIEFCLRGVVVQAKDTAARCGALIELNRDFHGRVTRMGASSRLTTLVDDLFLNPLVRVTDARDRLDVTYPTARSDLKKLERAGIVRLLEGTAQLTYFSPPILNAIYGD
jgi:Fic family protein